MDKLLNLIGLAKKAGKLEVGEEPVGAAARSKHARLILIASDAAENTRRRAKHFGDAGECICLEIPATKEALGKALGRTSCALLALTDIHSLRYHWVKGHAENEFNNRCDELAVAESQKYK